MWVPICQFSFSHLGFWSRNFFLIAPFPDRCLLVPFSVCFQMFINDYDQPPLEALTYLTGECNYGGRVTDDLDRRLIISLLKIFYCPQVINDDDYKFSASGKYFAPPKGSYQDYVAYIRSLPLIQHPEVSIAKRSVLFMSHK